MQNPVAPRLPVPQPAYTTPQFDARPGGQPGGPPRRGKLLVCSCARVDLTD